MRSLRAVRFVISALWFLGLFLGAAAAQIPATDDSYTTSSSPTSNYGTQPSLDVIGPGVNSYIRFDLTALPPGLTSSNVSKATLRLNVNGVTTSGTFDVYEVTKSWTEGAVTYNNAPPLGTKVNGGVMIPTSKRNFIDVDVTKAVQDWLSGTPANYGIALVPSSGSSISVSFDSKENTSTSHDPELNVDLISAGPAGQAATVTVGSTTTLAPGSLASVSNGGTSSAAVLNFAIPQGAPGTAGAPGAPGAPGLASSVQIGTVSTGSPGSQASVTNVGTSNAAVLNFSIPQGLAGTGTAPSSVLPAFLPGPLTQAYTAASFVPDSAITVTRISAALKTAPDANCPPAVLRVENGATGQDVLLTAGQSTADTGGMALPTTAGSTLQVQVQTPAKCPQTNPADANVLVEYRARQSGDTQACAQSGLVCNGICEETQSDANNCGACATTCPINQPCNAGTCGGGCSSGLTACNNTCVNLQADISNCGGCGNQCMAFLNPNPPTPTCQNATCNNGFIVCAAGSGLTACIGSCVSTVSDANNCGGCGKVCAQGQTCTSSQCVGTVSNGGSCTASTQCISGYCNAGSCANCTLNHSNGTGQSYIDCSNPLGTPGNAATYNQTMANEAAQALSGNGSYSSVSCNGYGAVTSSTSELFGVWVYQGPLAGYVYYSSVLNPFACPFQSSPTWN